MKHHDIPFSLEIDLKNTNQPRVARALQGLIAGSFRHKLTENWPNIWSTETERRIWQITKGDQSDQVRLITPPFTLESIETLKWLIQSLRDIGATFDGTTQMKISIDKRIFDVNSLYRLVQFFFKKQNAIYSFCNLPDQIIENHCRKLPASLMVNLSLLKPSSLDELRFAWYSSFKPRSANNQNHESQHYGLNLHAFFWGNEVKFQHFLATPNLTRLDNNIRLALMVTRSALHPEPQSQQQAKPN